MAIERLQYDCPHPCWQPHQALIVSQWAVLSCLGQGCRIDYHHDPAAPEPNSVVPAAVAVVAREGGAVLLIRRTDTGNWALPGGAIEMNESVAEAAVRETFEETGIQVEVTGLVDRDAAPLAAVTSIPSSRSRMITAAQGVGRETFGLMARVWHVSSRADAGFVIMPDGR